MKQLFLIGFVLFALAAAGQTKGTGKLYGYKESVAPGIPRRDLQEDGTEITQQPRARANYYIYLVTPMRAYPSEVWMNGEMYSASVRTITQTPVQHTNHQVPSEPVQTVLVPKTNERVIQITPAPAITSKQSSAGKRLAATNELVVVYRHGGKFYYQVLPKLSAMNGAAMQ
jgi:hypothetical protein